MRKWEIIEYVIEEVRMNPSICLHLKDLVLLWASHFRKDRRTKIWCRKQNYKNVERWGWNKQLVLFSLEVARYSDGSFLRAEGLEQ